jgi:ATP synthase protein I
MSDEKPTGPAPDAGDPRLDALYERLKAARQETLPGRERMKGPKAKGEQQGMRVLSELIGAPLGGALIGWLLDRWLGTKPWLLLVMLVFGFAVAVWSIIKIARQKPR